MIRINLIPPEIHAAEVRRQWAVVGMIFGGFIVFSMLLFLGWRWQKAHSLEVDLAKANDELQKYQAIVDEVKQLEQTRNQLKARRDVIQQLLKGRLLYPKFFEDLMSSLPPEIWITRLITEPNPQQIGMLNIKIEAQATSSFAITDWMTSLQTTNMFTAVELGPINATESEGRPPIYGFSLTFRYYRGDA